jgi:predicted nicotinamide N-methyase
MNVSRLNQNIRRTLADAKIVAMPLPLCPELKLFLISADNMQRAFSPHEIQTILANTPYWVFCWASGQALSYYILQNKDKFAGKCILDFGAGSGVVAIAAAMAEAKKVFACDIDGDAIDAIKANAALNEVQIDTCQSVDDITEPLDIIIAADVLYDRDNYPYLEKLLSYAPEILVADSRAKTIDVYPYQKITEITTTTLPDLDEFDEFKQVAIYQALMR